MRPGGAALVAVGADRVTENPRGAHCGSDPRPQSEASSVDGSLSCGNGLVLIRAYQGDHRRHRLTLDRDLRCSAGSTASVSHPRSPPSHTLVDNPFHISAPRPGPRLRTAFGRHVVVPASAAALTARDRARCRIRTRPGRLLASQRPAKAGRATWSALPLASYRPAKAGRATCWL